MALFHPDDPSYDESVRQTGFNRYKQLLSFHAGEWLKLNLLTTAGLLPFAVSVLYALFSSSVLVLIPCSIIGGMIFAPFWAGLVDSIQRGLRDDYGNWWKNYQKSWKHNWKESVLSGGFMGLLAGMFLFMAFMLWNRTQFVGWGTIALYTFSLLLFAVVNTLYWSQLVLFQQSFFTRMSNILLFTSKYLWRVLGASLFQLAWVTLMILFAPLTLIVIPFIGFWFVLFVSQFMLYDQLNAELHIEELYFPDRQCEDTLEERDE